MKSAAARGHGRVNSKEDRSLGGFKGHIDERYFPGRPAKRGATRDGGALKHFNTVWEGRRSIDRAPFIEPVRKAEPIRREGKVGYGRLFMATAAGFIPVRLRYSSRHST